MSDPRVIASPELTAERYANSIGIVPMPADDPGAQWREEAGIRSNLVPDKYPGHEGEIQDLNRTGERNAAAWAAGIGLWHLARPLKSIGSGGVARVSGEEFAGASEVDGVAMAYTPEPADFVMVAQEDVPENTGVMYGVADSHTVRLVTAGGAPRAAGVIHGIRDAVVKHDIGSKAPEFMAEQTGVDPKDMIAVIDPGLQVCCHQIGDEQNRGVVDVVQAAITQGTLPESALQLREGKYYFDARKSLAFQLGRAGVGRIVTSNECTAQLPGVHGDGATSDYPSLRRANATGVTTIELPSGLHVPAAAVADRVSRYPVMVGMTAAGA